MGVPSFYTQSTLGLCADVGENVQKHSVEFLQSQVDYYRKHMLSGNYTDRLLIEGCYNTYSKLLRENQKELKNAKEAQETST